MTVAVAVIIILMLLLVTMFIVLCAVILTESYHSPGSCDECSTVQSGC